LTRHELDELYGLTLVEGLRSARAVNVTRHGLGSGHADVITEIADRVRLTPLK
jgi:hypothetical protein